MEGEHPYGAPCIRIYYDCPNTPLLWWGCRHPVILLEAVGKKICQAGFASYYNEETSHLAVASTVGRGDANVGIGNKKASMQVETIDFIPIQTERYDLIIKKSDLNNPIYQNIISILSSDKFKNELQGIGGYDLKDLGKIIATT